MIALIRGEAIKLRSTRTALGFALAGVLLTLLTVLVQGVGGDPTSLEDKRSTLSIGGSIFVVLVIFGIVGATGEYRHRTVAPAVLIAPDRLRLLAARTLAYAVTAAGVAALMVIVGFALGIPLLSEADGPSLAMSDYLTVAGGGMLVCALGAAMGVGFGALVGNQVAGVVSALVYFFILESLVAVAKEELSKFTISAGSARLGGFDVGELSFLGALGVLAAWTALFLGLGMWRERGREVA